MLFCTLKYTLKYNKMYFYCIYVLYINIYVLYIKKIYAYMCVYVYMYFICIYVYVYVHVHTYTCVCIYVYIYIHICVYVHIKYMYICTLYKIKCTLKLVFDGVYIIDIFLYLLLARYFLLLL